jgi:hypothetical protein
VHWWYPSDVQHELIEAEIEAQVYGITHIVLNLTEKGRAYDKQVKIQ